MESIENWLRSLLEIRGAHYTYPTLVGSGLLHRIGSRVGKYLPGESCVIISDSNVAPLFGNPIKRSLTSAGFRPILIKIPAGEKSKTLEQAGAICDQMIAAGLDRQSFVVGLGGGVVGDISGFVAAIYHRGIPHVQIPTTLLAMVDSSIGGKTGVNTRDGKNLIGAFHHPMLVIDDTDVLKTLPRREFNQGFAEIVKNAVIADAKLFEDLKVAPLLNFGHTVGHAIERAGDYRKFLHGEALSLGIVAACAISVKRAGLSPNQRDAIVDLLRQFELPTRLPKNFPSKKIFDALKFDKKFEGGKVRFVVTPRIGAAHLVTDVTLQDIREAIEDL
ncbi:MAG: 3-dehydroquinate synthase [Verrucomicrobia bacterium]|nr:MAG: 3-dehydroquinate synthase [Verrucomicrobiota bacterium]